MTGVKLTLAYVGTWFSGWQIQENARTVQGCLEQALTTICRRPVRVHGSGRTDAGVHATGQAAHFIPPPERTATPWRRALNALLPRDMAVIRADAVPADFHARFNARSKLYSYTLWTEPAFVLPQRRPFVWSVGRLDLTSMQEAADRMLGVHDFAAFQNVGTPVKTTTREMLRADFLPDGDREVVWSFQADGFLKQMVRNLMGCLVEVGRGRLSAGDVISLMEQRDRTLLPATAPPQGLCLEKVFYADSGRQR